MGNTLCGNVVVIAIPNVTTGKRHATIIIPIYLMHTPLMMQLIAYI